MCGCNKDRPPLREVGDAPRMTRTPPMTITAQLLEPKDEALVEKAVKQEPPKEQPKRLVKFL